MATRGATTAQRTEYKANDYDHLIGAVGFSDEMLETHFGLYRGYVKHTNKALEILQDEGIDAYARKEVQRRFVWEFNGIRLHELYFDGMVGNAERPGDGEPLQEALEANFGSFEEWLDDFRTVGTTRGIGWAALVHDPIDDNLLNLWVNEHDAGPLARSNVVLIMDVWEHAFMRDFGTDRKAYMDTYFDAVDWTEAARRLASSRTGAAPAPTQVRPSRS